MTQTSPCRATTRRPARRSIVSRRPPRSAESASQQGSAIGQGRAQLMQNATRRCPYLPPHPALPPPSPPSARAPPPAHAHSPPSATAMPVMRCAEELGLIFDTIGSFLEANESMLLNPGGTCNYQRACACPCWPACLPALSPLPALPCPPCAALPPCKPPGEHPPSFPPHNTPHSPPGWPPHSPPPLTACLLPPHTSPSLPLLPCS